ITDVGPQLGLGRHVVLPADRAPEGADATPHLPGTVIVGMQGEGPLDLTDEGAPALVQVDLDPVASLAWPVLTPGPLQAAQAWGVPERSAPFTAVLHPERLSAPQRAGAAEADAEGQKITVLVAPGVDRSEEHTSELQSREK